MRYLLFFALVFAFRYSYGGKYGLGISSSYLSIVQTQEPQKDFWERVRFGGNVGLQFGNPTNVILSPSIGYIPRIESLEDRLMVGVGVTYMYNRWKYSYGSYESNIYGGREFLRCMVLDNIFAYTEHEFLNAPNYYDNNGEREWVNSLFLGGGFLQRFSDRGGISITVLYNLAWTPNNPIYASPWNFRVGFML